MPLKSKEVVLYELRQMIKALDAIVMHWVNCPWGEILFEMAQEANKMSLHFQNAVRAIEQYA